MANRVLALLSVLFNLAIEREMRTDNPRTRIAKAPEGTARDILSPTAEIGKLAGVRWPLHAETVSAAAMEFLMLTGAPQ